jgi:hypothetical protein
MCKEYLQDKAKYFSFCKPVEAGNAKKVECPIGSKRAKQEEEDKKLLEMPDQKCMLKEKLETHLAAEHAKR